MKGAKMPENVTGFFLLGSYSGRFEKLAFRCQDCHLEMLFAEKVKTGTVRHCNRTDVFLGRWWERLFLPRRRLAENPSPIMILPDNSGEMQ
jgi:hypothetical protein